MCPDREFGSEIFQYVNDQDAMSLINTWMHVHRKENESLQKLLFGKLERNTLNESSKNRLDLILHYDSAPSNYAILDSVKNKEI